MNSLKVITFCFFCLVATSVTAQDILEKIKPREHSYVRRGNEAYKEGRYAESQAFYQKAITSNRESKPGTFNLGDAYFQQGKYKEAADQFRMAANLSEDKADKARAYHNLGNTYLKEEKYKEGVEAYKNALRNNPKDQDTRYNLAYALNRLKQQQQQDQQNQDENQDQNQDSDNQDGQDGGDNKNKNKDKNKDQENKENENKENENKNKDQQQQDQNDDQQQGEQNGKKDGELQERKMSKEEIERMLEALRFQEEQLQKDLQKRKASGKKVKVEKDW